MDESVINQLNKFDTMFDMTAEKFRQWNEKLHPQLGQKNPTTAVRVQEKPAPDPRVREEPARDPSVSTNTKISKDNAEQY